MIGTWIDHRIDFHVQSRLRIDNPGVACYNQGILHV